MKKDVALIALGLVVFMVLYVLMQLFLPFAVMEEPVQFEIAPGMTFRDVTNTLIEQDLVRDSNLFIAMGRITGFHRHVIPGEYSFSGQVSPWNVFRTVKEGKVRLWDVTLLEGVTLDLVRLRLAEDELVSEEDFDHLKGDPRFLNELDIKAPTLEGYLFPDTYRFARGLAPRKVLTMMVNRTRQVLTPRIMKKARALGFDENDVLTLASIIEKEARVDEERRIISAVYHNRLRKGMRLQADPTVVYGIKPMHDGIRYKDLLRSHPYNTYLIKGLPPGPIGSPGQKSIRAAVNPAHVPYIFFVSNYDGTHTFTSTLKEHRKAVKNFRIKRAEANRAVN